MNLQGRRSAMLKTTLALGFDLSDRLKIDEPKRKTRAARVGSNHHQARSRNLFYHP